MRDKARISEMIKLIEEIWNENPDFRLGQLIVNAVKPSEPCPQVFYVEDDVMMNKLKDLLSIMRIAQKGQTK
jgi:uncharacterized protein YihD (DUF1040 family)